MMLSKEEAIEEGQEYFYGIHPYSEGFSIDAKIVEVEPNKYQLINKLNNEKLKSKREKYGKNN